MLLANSSTILKKFLEFNASIVISTERSCWPDNNLVDRYPIVDLDGYRFLNSGGLLLLLVNTYKLTISFHQRTSIYYVLINCKTFI